MLLVKRSVIATKYVSFQYKLVMRILTTNTFLFLINKRDDNKCTFCSDAPETLSHLFLVCRYVELFWRNVTSFLVKHCIDPLTENEKIFGKINSPKVTHIVTLAKYYIYDCRRNEARPSFAHFEARLKIDIETEREIARRKNTMENFNKKWNSMKI